MSAVEDERGDGTIKVVSVREEEKEKADEARKMENGGAKREK